MTTPKSPPQPAVSVEQEALEAVADAVATNGYDPLWSYRLRARDADALRTFDKEINVAQACIERLVASGGPSTPTAAMIKAGRAAYQTAIDNGDLTEVVSDIWIAMHRLSATPPGDGVHIKVEEADRSDWPQKSAEEISEIIRQAYLDGGLAATGQTFTWNSLKDAAYDYMMEVGPLVMAAAPKAPTAPIGEVGVSVPDADGLKSIGHDLAMAAGNLVVATDGQEAIRVERIAVLNALKAWEKAIADRAQGEGEKAS